jgi:hypothetical protein
MQERLSAAASFFYEGTRLMEEGNTAEAQNAFARRCDWRLDLRRRMPISAWSWIDAGTWLRQSGIIERRLSWPRTRRKST